MSYNKQNFVNGQPLTAQQLNHIENGIVQLNTELNNVNTEITNIEDNYATKDFVRSEINNAEIGGDGELDVDLSIYALKTEIPKYIQTGALSDSTIGFNATVEGAANIASGDYSHAEGYQTETTGVAAHAEGAIYNNVKTSANGQASHAEGAGTRALVDAAHTEGVLTLAGRTYEEAQQAAVDLNISFDSDEELYMKLLGYGAHAEGTNTQALGSSSHAEGSLTQALTNSSHAEGDSTYARGEASHAEGYDTTASGNQSHAEGKSTLASGNSSHAEGKESKATGYCAHAEGLNTLAQGLYSHAEGIETIALAEAQHVQGRYNIEDTADTYAHIVGNGTEEDGRSNAYTLDWDGNAWFAGAINCKDKTTTLANLGAAPAGYGLGEVSPSGLIQTTAALDAAKATGWYRFYGYDSGSYWNIGGYLSGLIEVKGSRTATDGIRQYFYPDGCNGYLVRMMAGGAWSKWEWVNPPMIAGQEYRTTERWNGKPVYAKLVNIGTLPSSASKYYSIGIAPNAYEIIDSSVRMKTSGTYTRTRTQDNLDYCFDVGSDGNYAMIVETTADFSNFTCDLTVKYIPK